MESLVLVSTVLFAFSAGLSFILFGCAAQKPVHHESHFWHGCQETILAKPDGFQHFTCFDVKDKQWEVQVKPKEKK